MFRWAVVYIGLFGVSILVILGFIYRQTGNHLAHHVDTVISGDLEDLVQEYESGRMERLSSAIASRLHNDHNRIYLLTDGVKQFAGNLDKWPGLEADAAGWVDFELPCLDPAHCDEPRHIRAKIRDLPGGLRLLTGRDVDDIDDIKEAFQHALGWGLALIMALGMAGGVVLSLAVMHRLEAISRTSREIMRGDLSQRVPLRGVGDDFDELARNLNAMLDRIQTLMATVRGVSDNIAHDLRTPLTRLKTRLELARAARPSAEDYEAWIDGTTANLDAVLETFEALLKIAEVEASSPQQSFAAVNLSEIVFDAVEFYEPLAEQKRQQLELLIQPVPPLLGERDLLFRALANLLDNAIKYAPEESRIEISLEASRAGAKLIVADRGPGIPEELRAKVFERFFRLDTSRSLPGSGLGLSMVSAVARVHGTSVCLEDNRPGLRVVIEFSLSQPGGAESQTAAATTTPQARSLSDSAA